MNCPNTLKKSQFANNVAKIGFVDGRYELRLLGKIKAVTEGSTLEVHEAAKGELVLYAKEKGYTVIEA